MTRGVKQINRSCSILGCPDEVSAKGLCGFHYHRLWKYGSVMADKLRHGPKIHRASGTGHVTHQGYLTIRINNVSKFEHTWIVEKVLGKSLPKKAIIHHIDGDTLNNNPSNLIVFPNQAYHVEFHKRQRAYEACGHANWKSCEYCHKYDDP